MIFIALLGIVVSVNAIRAINQDLTTTKTKARQPNEHEIPTGTTIESFKKQKQGLTHTPLFRIFKITILIVLASIGSPKVPQGCRGLHQ